MAKNNEKDVGFMMDIITGVADCVHAEHHALRSFSSTDNKQFIDLARKLREIRSFVLYKFVPDKKGELWCITKHLSGVTKALEEWGNRFLEEGDQESAETCFRYMGDIEAYILILNDWVGGANGK